MNPNQLKLILAHVTDQDMPEGVSLTRPIGGISKVVFKVFGEDVFCIYYHANGIPQMRVHNHHEVTGLLRVIRDNVQRRRQSVKDYLAKY